MSKTLLDIAFRLIDNISEDIKDEMTGSDNFVSLGNYSVSGVYDSYGSKPYGYELRDNNSHFGNVLKVYGKLERREALKDLIIRYIKELGEI